MNDLAQISLALNLANAILSQTAPLFQKMMAEGRTKMTAQEIAEMRAVTDASRAYAVASQPGMPAGPGTT